MFGSAIMISESELQEGLIIGTDDGVPISLRTGGVLVKTTRFSGVPDMTYIDDVQASLHDKDTVYAVMENHKQVTKSPMFEIYKQRENLEINRRQLT